MIISAKTLACLTEGFTNWSINSQVWLCIVLCSHWLLFFFFLNFLYIFESVLYKAIKTKASDFNKRYPQLRFGANLLGFSLSMSSLLRKSDFQRSERRCIFMLHAFMCVYNHINTINIFYGKTGIVFYLAFSVLVAFTLLVEYSLCFFYWGYIQLNSLGRHKASRGFNRSSELCLFYLFFSN